jgi:predicted regulator of Ras-like GTPase activity (Roadblock/LC7/MglB family)
MDFKESLKRIAEKIDDFRGVAIVDSDGILVEECKEDPLFDLNPLVAEYSAFLKAADKASVSAEVGTWHEVIVTTEKATIMIKKMTEGYFLFMVMQSEKNIGKGRFFMKKEAAVLVEDL